MTELLESGFLELKSELARDDLAAGEHCDVAEHFLAAVAEAGSLDRYAVERAAELIENESRESFAFDILCNDEQACTALDDLFKKGKDLLDVRDLLIGNKNKRVVENGFHLVGIGCHVGGEITAVELHAFDYFAVGFGGLGLLNGDNAVCGDLFHSVCDQGTDHLVTCGDSAYAGDVCSAVDLLGISGEVCDGAVYSLLDTAADNHRICACGYVLHALVDECLSEKSSGGGAVSGSIVGLGRNFADELCAHVLGCVLKLDLLCDGNTVVGDQRSAELLVEDNVSALRSESDLNRICKLIYACEKSGSCICSVKNILSHCKSLLLLLNYCENVVLTNDVVFGITALYFGACVLAGDYTVADLNGHNDFLAVYESARTYRNDLRHLRLFLSTAGENDSRRGLFLCFDRLYYNAVCQRFDIHNIPPAFVHRTLFISLI